MTYTMFPDLRNELTADDDQILARNNIKCPELPIKVNNINVVALIDTGSSINGISEEWYNAHKDQLGEHEILSITNTFIVGAVGGKSKNVRKQILCEITINGIKRDCVFLIIPGLVRDCILGIHLLKQEGCAINIRDNYITFQEHNDLPERSDEPQHIPLLTINTTDNELTEQIEKKIQSIEGVDTVYLRQLRQLLISNKDVFSDRPGRIRGYQHSFRVTDETPFMQKGWPVPIAYQRAVDEEISKMLNYGIIERANSPYINPLVTVIKKDGRVRLCLDARQINSVTVPDYEGPPPINEILANCGKMNIMSTIDLTSSFWQIPLEESCRNYTGFLYKGKCFRFTVTPFGLNTSLASLTRGLDAVMTEEAKQCTIIYVDDCLCYSQSMEEHLQHIQLLLDNFKRANITINLEKSKFFRQEIQYLGYCLTTDGIKATPEKVSAILNFPTPKNQKQLKGFLGLTNFYNRFTSKYAEYTQPLLKLLQKGIKFKWTQEIDDQFNTVKQLFVDTVMLKFPRVGRRFYLQCDASKYAYGGQLYQLDDNNEIAVIAFTSRTFKGAEKNYFTTEKELLSIVQCLKKFRIYILGQPLTIITDNKALTFLQQCHLNNSRITRWILSIQEYRFNVIHCKGKDNIVADILSRYPEDMQAEETITDTHEYFIHGIAVKLHPKITQILKNISQLQTQNNKLQKIISQLKNNDNHKLSLHYTLENDKLYRKAKTGWKLYVPKEVRNEMIQGIHEMYGHLGSKKLCQILKEHFTMDRMYKSVMQITKICDTCQRCKDGANRRLRGETQPMLPKEKGELVSVDFYGPLPTSSGGVKHILVVVDNFTKFAKLYAVRRATTTAAIRRIQQYASKYGRPTYILSDNGTQFTAKGWNRELEQMGITPKFTAIRNPCTNIAERWNRQLGNLFRILVRERHTRWASYLNVIEACLNETYQETIEMTPFEAHFGHKPKRLWEKFLDECAINKEQVDHHQIYLRIREKRKRNADQWNEKHKLSELDVGDQVLVHTYPMSDAAQHILAKFCALYEGPYVITRRIGKSTYELRDNKDPIKMRGIFNIRQLKPYHSDSLR